MTRIAYVTFNEDKSWDKKRYAYKCPHKVAVGDIAIVRVDGIEKLTTVCEVGYDDERATKTILSIIDKSEERRERDRKNRALAIRKELNEIETALRFRDRMAALAKRSSKARKLITELKRIEAHD